MGMFDAMPAILATNKLPCLKPVDVTMHPIILNEIEDSFIEGDHGKHRHEQRGVSDK
jgi:hypothetical protein